ADQGSPLQGRQGDQEGFREPPQGEGHQAEPEGRQAVRQRAQGQPDGRQGKQALTQTERSTGRKLFRIAALTASLGVLALAPGTSTRAAGPTAPAATWNVVSPLPQGLDGAAAAADPLYFAYFFGGYKSTSDSVVDTAYRWNSVNERGEERAPMVDAVEGASAVYVPSDTDPRVFVFGGDDGSTGFSTATRIYDVFANSWSTGANLPAARSFMVSGYNAANGKIYLVGGKSPTAAAENTTWEYAPGTNTFATKASITNAVAGAAGGVASGHLYVAGGQDSTGAPVPYAWDYNIALD